MNEVTDGAPNLPPVPPKRRRAPRKKTITTPASESFMAAEPPQTSLNVDYPLPADEESASSPEPNQQCSCPQGPLRWIFLALAAVVLFAVVMLINDRIKTLPPVNPNGQNGNGQGNDSLTEKLAGQSKIMKFENYDDLKEFLENNQNVGSGPYYGDLVRSSGTLGLEATDTGMKEQAVNPSLAPAGHGGGSNDFSTTNVQVEGVDEADIIKTDGKYVYAVTNQNIFIVDAYPADGASVLSKIEFKSQPQDIYISDDRLVVFGTDYEIAGTPRYKEFHRQSTYTFFKIFDISDRKNPREIRDIDIEGTYFNSRMIGDYVYFITSNYSYAYYDDEIPVPRIIDGGEEVYDRTTSKCAKCPDVYYFNLPYESYNFTNIAAINIKDAAKEINSQVYLLSGGQNLYVSEDNIYITYTKQISQYQLTTEVAKEVVFPRLGERDQQRIRKIEETDSYILSDSEKANKIAAIIEKYKRSLTDSQMIELEKEIQDKMQEKYDNIAKELEKTVIHKIAIDKDSLEYKTFGEVTGHVLNQFSMDENNGYFRIATTKNRTWLNLGIKERRSADQQQSFSNVYVLDKDLKQVGAVEELAKGEQIYSVRFMQNRAYLVTFVQTDPLFVIDLADPKAPKVLGELKVPGFSNYLHPYDDNTLIGIGKETETNIFGGGVRQQGVKLSLFDVSNVSEPKEIDKYVFEDGSDSIALHEHKAFLFSKDKNLLVIPITNNQGWVDGPVMMEEQDGVRSSMPARTWFSGAAVFHVDRDGFDLKGLIDHSNDNTPAVQESYCGWYCYDNSVQRSLYIDETLYTFSNRYLQANRIDNLDEVKRLRLRKGADDFRVVN